MRLPIRRRPGLFTVRGYMRSGTNWVANLVNQHPEVASIGEFHWERMLAAYAELPLVGTGKRHHHRSKVHIQNAIRQTIEDACRDAAPTARLRWVGDRTPSTLDLDLFPKAHHLVVTRDVRDVVVSRAYHLYSRPHIAKHLFRDESARSSLRKFQGNPNHFLDHPEELLASDEMVMQTATTWARHVEADRHTLASHPGARVLELRYERLHQSTESERRRMFEFLELDPSLAGELGGKTSPGFQTEQPTALLRKGAVGDWTNYFTEHTRRLVDAEAGDIMRRLGYDLDAPAEGAG